MCSLQSTTASSCHNLICIILVAGIDTVCLGACPTIFDTLPCKFCRKLGVSSTITPGFNPRHYRAISFLLLEILAFCQHYNCKVNTPCDIIFVSIKVCLLLLLSRVSFNFKPCLTLPELLELTFGLSLPSRSNLFNAWCNESQKSWSFCNLVAAGVSFHSTSVIQPAPPSLTF